MARFLLITGMLIAFGTMFAPDLLGDAHDISKWIDQNSWKLVGTCLVLLVLGALAGVAENRQG